MDKVTVSLKNKVEGYYKLNVLSLVERDDELVLELENNECYSINEGDYLLFNRIIKKEDGSYENYEDMVKVKYEDSSHLIHTELLPTYTTYFDYGKFVEINDDVTDSYYIIHCKDKHHLFPQDLDLNVEQELYLKISFLSLFIA